MGARRSRASRNVCPRAVYKKALNAGLITPRASLGAEKSGPHARPGLPAYVRVLAGVVTLLALLLAGSRYSAVCRSREPLTLPLGRLAYVSISAASGSSPARSLARGGRARSCWKLAFEKSVLLGSGFRGWVLVARLCDASEWVEGGLCVRQ